MEPPCPTRSNAWRELDARIPGDHLVRMVDRLVDSELDLEPLWRSYSGRGSPAHGPDLLLKLVLYEHLSGRPSPTQWLQDSRENQPVQWLIRGMRPSQTSLYEFRDRLAPFVEAWNAQAIRTAVDEGLTTARAASLDGTTIAACASRHRLLSLERLEQRIDQLKAPAGQIPGSKDSSDSSQQLPVASEPPAWRAKTPRGRALQKQRYDKARRRLRQQHRINQQRRSDKRKTANTLRISPSDPEACLGRDKVKVFRPLYNVQVMTDLSTDLILAYTVHATAGDSGQLIPLIKRTEAITRRALPVVLADAGYPSGADLAWCHEHGTTVYAPWQQNDFTASASRGRALKQLPKDRFTWNATNRQYLCPQGHTLTYATKTSKQKSNGQYVTLELYRAEPADCQNCPLRASCVQSKSGARTVRRQPHEEHIDALKSRMKTPEAKALYRKRCQTVERSFADLKEHRNLRRFSGWGLQRARTQTGMTILAQNLRTLDKLRTSQCRPHSATSEPAP